MHSLRSVRRLIDQLSRESHVPLHEILAHLRDSDPDSTEAENLAVARQAVLQLLAEQRVQLEQTVHLANHYRRLPARESRSVIHRESPWLPPDPRADSTFFCLRSRPGPGR